MSSSAPTATALRRAFSGWTDAPTMSETGGRPRKRRTGPVLMGDIHGSRAGTPLLLLLWAQWEQDAAEDDGD